MKASAQIVLKGGTYTVDTEDDAFHSNGNFVVSGGTVSYTHLDVYKRQEDTDLDFL